MTMWWLFTGSLFLNITWFPLAVATGLGTNEPLPCVPTTETVTMLGVEGAVGVDVEPPPLHPHDAIAAAPAVRRINDDRMLLLLQEKSAVWMLSKGDTSAKSCRISRTRARGLPSA